jgi:hypothetical protein
MDSATVNGVELEYEMIGSGEPVLLISPVLADGFLPLLSEPALADRYQLIRYHKRGWAGSSPTPTPVSVADHAADAAALLDHLGLPCAHIAGHSTGANAAAQLALDHPDTVHTLTLLEPWLLSMPSGEAVLQQAGPAFEAYARGDHEAAWAIFLSVGSGLDWATCRALLDDRLPGAVAQAIRTPTPCSASSYRPSPSGHSVPSKQPPSTTPCCPCTAATPGRCGSKAPPSSARHCHTSRTAPSTASAISCTSNVPSPSHARWPNSWGATPCPATDNRVQQRRRRRTGCAYCYRGRDGSTARLARAVLNDKP